MPTLIESLAKLIKSPGNLIISLMRSPNLLDLIVSLTKLIESSGNLRISWPSSQRAQAT